MSRIGLPHFFQALPEEVRQGKGAAVSPSVSDRSVKEMPRVPGLDASVPERISYCKNVRKIVETNALSPEQEIAHLTNIAGQLAYLPSDKKNGVRTNNPMPLNENFDFVMNRLRSGQATYHRNITYTFGPEGTKVKVRGAGNVIAAPNEKQLAWRVDAAPVWAKLIEQAPRVNERRQDNLLGTLRENFDHLPTSSERGAIRKRIVQAHQESFANLVRALPALQWSLQTDKLPRQQRDASDLLRKCAGDMTMGQRAAMKVAVDDIRKTNTGIIFPYHPLSIELWSLSEKAFSEPEVVAPPHPVPDLKALFAQAGTRTSAP